MKPGPLSHVAMFDLTSGLIGHIDDEEQLEYIIYFTSERLKLVKRLNESKKKGRQVMQQLRGPRKGPKE